MLSFRQPQPEAPGHGGRYEVKLVCPAWRLPEVRVWMTLHPECFQEAYPVRQVNSLYLDTLSHDGLDANLSGIGERAKLRLRWYGQEHHRAQTQLELKRRIHRLGWKEIQPLPGPLDLPSLSWAELLARLRADATPAFRSRLVESDRPTLIVSYQRGYYCSADGDLRITLDQGLQLYEQYLQPAPNLCLAAPPTEDLIVEIKADVRFHRRVSDLLSSCPWPVSRNSKYIVGMHRALAFW
ncbi:MAG: VTC domain-containing protein [Anaerolineae bacterium]|nr:VTC domain-containing protein [Anaerolineae bacterium]